MYLETINEKAFRSFLSNPDISVLDGNVLDKHHNSDFYRFVRVPLSDGEHSVEALFGQMCSNYPTSMSKNHFSEQHNLEFMAYVVDHEKTYAERYEFLRLLMSFLNPTFWKKPFTSARNMPEPLKSIFAAKSCRGWAHR